MSTQLVSPAQSAKAIEQLFKSNAGRIVKAVPRSIAADPSRLLSIAYNAIIYDEKLAQCTHASLLGGVMEALKLGITIGGVMQESWLVPFNNKRRKKNDKGQWGDEWVLEATLIIGYQGYRNVIDRGRAVMDMHPRAVHVDDAFEYEFGNRPFIKHKPKKPVLTKADLRAVYIVANLRGGGQQMEVLELDEIEQHRMRSRAKDTGPWASAVDYVPMALKTAVRKVAKYLPKSSELLARALDLDDKADRGIDQDFELPEGTVLFDQEPAPPATPPRLEALKERMGVVKPGAEAEKVPARELRADEIFGPGEKKTDEYTGFGHPTDEGE